MLEFRLLGPLEVRRNGTVLSVKPKKARDLLTMLLIEGSPGASLGQIVDGLWPQKRPNTAINSVHVYISGLRKILGDSDRELIRLLEDGYRIDLDGNYQHALDIRRFEERVTSGVAELRAGRDQNALAALDEALGLVYGRMLADVADEPFAQLKLAYLEHRRREAIEGRLRAMLSLGSAQRVAVEARQFVHDDPFNEGVWALLIQSLYQLQRRTEALRAYQALVDRLAEAGLQPSVELREMEKRVVAEDPSLNPTVRIQPGNLPPAVEAPIEADLISQVVRDLDVEQAIAIIGPEKLARNAAVGAAQARIQRYPDGVWLLEVRGLRHRREVVRSVLDAVGIISGPNPEATLIEFVTRRTMLFILVSADDVVDGLEGLISDLTCANSQAVITLRDPPAPTTLLLRAATSTASRASPDSGRNVQRLKRHTSDSAPIQAPAGLLILRLQCFQGPVTLAAIRAVAAFDPIDPRDTDYLVSQLVANGQVAIDNSERMTRFVLNDEGHGTGDTQSGQLWSRHLEYCAELATAALAAVGGPGWNDSLASMRAERSEFGAAIEFALEQQRMDEAFQIGHAIGLYWSTQGSHLGKAITTLGKLLDHYWTASSDVAGVSLSAGFAHFRSGSYLQAEQLFNQAVAIADEVEATALQGYARAERAHLLMFAGRHGEAKDNLDQASDLAIASGLRALQCRIDMLTAQLAMREPGSTGQRWQHDTLVAAAEVLGRLNYRPARANCMLVLSSWYLDVDDAERATHEARQALDIAQLEDDRSMVAFALARLAECDGVAGNSESCYQHASEALAIAVEVGNWLVAAQAALVLGMSDQAAALPGGTSLGHAFMAIRDGLGVPITDRESQWLSRLGHDATSMGDTEPFGTGIGEHLHNIDPGTARGLLFSVAAAIRR